MESRIQKKTLHLAQHLPNSAPFPARIRTVEFINMVKDSYARNHIELVVQGAVQGEAA
jgi:hypothetical protein